MSELVQGFHGRGGDLTSTGCAISEGNGIYVARTVELAHFFDPDIEIVEYVEPANPLIVDGEPLYILEGNSQIFSPGEQS